MPTAILAQLTGMSDGFFLHPTTSFQAYPDRVALLMRLEAGKRDRQQLSLISPRCPLAGGMLLNPVDSKAFSPATTISPHNPEYGTGQPGRGRRLSEPWVLCGKISRLKILPDANQQPVTLPDAQSVDRQSAEKRVA